MTSAFVRVTLLTVAIVAFHPGIAVAQGKVVVWLDEPKPASWNKPGLSIPAAPKIDDEVDPRCRELARPSQLDEDTRLRDEGWDLVGAYQGGWQILVIRGTAGYDGMCRPRQYQDFVFVRGVFAGTLSPQPMDSRADGALARVSLQSSGQLIAEYARYTATDPLCCPSRMTRVVFEIANDPPIARPASMSTTDTRVGSPGAAFSRPLERSYWRATELGHALEPGGSHQLGVRFPRRDQVAAGSVPKHPASQGSPRVCIRAISTMSAVGERWWAWQLGHPPGSDRISPRVTIVSTVHGAASPLCRASSPTGAG